MKTTELIDMLREAGNSIEDTLNYIFQAYPHLLSEAKAILI